jgi:hypothetical protein
MNLDYAHSIGVFGEFAISNARTEFPFVIGTIEPQTCTKGQSMKAPIHDAKVVD